MKSEIIRFYDDFIELGSIWDELLQQCQNNTIFLTFEWLLAWWEDYGAGHKLFIIIIRNDKNIIAIAPFMITKERKLQFIGHDVSDYLDIIIADEKEKCFELIFETLKRFGNEWDWAEFVYIPQDSPFFGLWEKNLKKLKTIQYEIKLDCFSIVLDLYKNGGNWESLEKTLPPKRRNDLKRCSRLLNEMGKLSFHRLSKFKEIEAAFAYFASNHKRRWKEAGQGSQFDSDLQNKHYLNTARMLAPKGWVELSCIMIDGEYVAMAFGYIYEGRYYYYTPTFNPDYWKCSPGNVLIKYLIESFYQEGKIKVFDMLRGQEKYKYSWAKDERPLYRITIYPRKLLSLFIYFRNSTVSIALPRLQKFPFLRKIKHTLLRLSGK
ncbi:GNAT family N-acetyltransferase [Candidatus Saganbacteria bacterium]|nr:GNAT family N-acetyltransferase [Candidatus Saganbacteria bacterium]